WVSVNFTSSVYRPRVRIFSVVTGPTFGADDTILKEMWRQPWGKWQDRNLLF
ncbi:hypothetical protein Q5P01_000039, partial [Channa striata]